MNSINMYAFYDRLTTFVDSQSRISSPLSSEFHRDLRYAEPFPATQQNDHDPGSREAAYVEKERIFS